MQAKEPLFKWILLNLKFILRPTAIKKEGGNAGENADRTEFNNYFPGRIAFSESSKWSLRLEALASELDLVPLLVSSVFLCPCELNHGQKFPVFSFLPCFEVHYSSCWFSLHPLEKNVCVPKMESQELAPWDEITWNRRGLKGKRLASVVSTTTNHGRHLGKGSESVLWILWWRTPEHLSPPSLPVGARLTEHGASCYEAGPDRCSFVLHTTVQTAALGYPVMSVFLIYSHFKSIHSISSKEKLNNTCLWRTMDLGSFEMTSEQMKLLYTSVHIKNKHVFAQTWICACDRSQMNGCNGMNLFIQTFHPYKNPQMSIMTTNSQADDDDTNTTRCPKGSSNY